MKIILFITIIIANLLLYSCKTLEPESVAQLQLTIPKTFSKDVDVNINLINNKIKVKNNKIENRWWSCFNNNELSSLIENALKNNFNIHSMKNNINIAKALVAKEEASFFPNFGFSLGGQTKGANSKITSESDSNYNGSNSFDAGLNGSYNVDIWGKTNAKKQAQVLNLNAIKQDWHGYTLEISTQIAKLWIDIIEVRNKKNILSHQIESNKTLLELQKLRFTNGKANALDISQQQKALAEANSQVPLLEKQEQLLLNNMAFLSGKTEAKYIKINTKILPDPIVIPKIGFPSDLLANRLDIKAAKMRLNSAQWNITAAKTDLLPSFNLTAQAMFSSGKLDLLFYNWITTLAGSITGPIFDGGRREAEIKRVTAIAKEQLNLYSKIVAKAIFEVENNLVSIEKQAVYIKLLQEELKIARQTLKNAMIQYQNGQSSYLSYLITWTNIENLERQLIGEKAIYIKEQIKLYSNLGIGAL